MPVLVTRKVFHDYEALQDLVPDNKSDVMQLGSGQMSGSLTNFHIDPDFDLATGTFSLPVRATGTLSNSRFALGFLTKTDGPAVGHHHEFDAGDLAIAAPGEDRYMRFNANSEYAVGLIQPANMQAFLDPTPGAFDLLLKHKLSVLHVSPEMAAANIAHLQTLLTELDRPEITDDATNFIKRHIMSILTEPIRDGVPYRGARLVRMDDLVRDVGRWLDGIGSRPVHISEICEHFGVNARMLHRAFDEVLSTPPITYLRRKRLNDVHAALRRDGLAMTIKDVARAHGFFELGRFAADYRHLFGEKPSQTLQRSKRAARAIVTALFGLHFAFAHAVRLLAVWDAFV